MATRTLGDTGVTAPAGGLFRRALARIILAREIQARRAVSAHLARLDDSTLATFGCDRAGLLETGRRPSPL